MAIDILILVVLAAGLIMGFAKGIINQLATVAGVVGGIVAARLFGARVAAFLGGLVKADTLDYVIGYAIVFIAAYLAVWVIVKVFRSAVHCVGLGIFDRIAGAVLKAAVYLLVLSLALNLYIIFKGNGAVAVSHDKPWREAVVKYAPALLGFNKEEKSTFDGE